MDSYQDQAAKTGSVVTQNATLSRNAATPQRPALSPQQLKVIDLMAEGKTVAACAQGVSVSRSTIHRWFKDPEFQAAYNSWKAETQAEARGRLLALLDPAINAVAKRLEAGDLKAATLLLKGLGFLQPIPPGPQDVEAIDAEAHTADLKRRQTRQREMLDSMGLSVFPDL